MILTHRVYEGQITIYKAKGRVTFPEVCAEMIDFTRGGDASRVLCDFTCATAADLTTTEVEKIFKRIGRRMIGIRGVRAAIVAQGEVDVGLAQMFGTFSEIADLPVEVKTFRSAEIARKWLSNDN